MNMMNLNQLLQLQQRIPFTTPFIQKENDVWRYIQAIDHNIAENIDLTGAQHFKNIFNTIPIETRSMFLRYVKQRKEDDDKDDGERRQENPLQTYLTIDNLKKWICITWPPSLNRFSVILKLRNEMYHRNEDPNFVYLRLQHKIDETQQMITLTNEHNNTQIPK
eukprot:451344_1